jgi:enamine deaminase RidA (YjgF/YER057c/UK114 family)
VPTTSFETRAVWPFFLALKASAGLPETLPQETFMSVRRIEAGPRMSQAVIHGNTVYLAGQVGGPGKSVTEQTKDVLASVDRLLKEAGTDKSKLLQAIIWLDDMKDFGEMNAVWDAWVDSANAPARATGEAKLATPEYKVEIIITAAI